MSKVWGNIGAWAAEAERAEEEDKQQAAVAAAPPQSYPSLKEAVNANKGKKKTKMTLQEFTMAAPRGGSRIDSGLGYKLTPEEMMRLPTGPKERSAEEMQYGRIGGGFSAYGGGRAGGGVRMRERGGDGDGDWGSNRRFDGGFDGDRRGSFSRVSEFDQPSRADEVDNWTMAKKPIMPSSISGNRPNRYGPGTGAGSGGFSRADEVDNWVANKKPIPPAKSSNFRDQERPTERRRLELDPPRVENSPIEPIVKTNKPNPFGAARPREEILAEKGVDWKKLDMEFESKKSSSRPASSSSRPGSAQSGRSVDGLERPKPKVNPFGDAKPREVLLQEKGVDYQKIDLELELGRVDRPETEAEKNLKQEIDNLKRELKKESTSDAPKESLRGSNDNQANLRDMIIRKEKELAQLILDLDDKVRFGQKAVERPGSGAGRIGYGFQERPPSQSGSFDEAKNADFLERPWSRGTGESWVRTGDDRRGYGRGRERGFLGNRDLDRSSSRERW